MTYRKTGEISENNYGILSENANNILILIRLSVYFFLIAFVFILNVIFEEKTYFALSDFSFHSLKGTIFLNIGILIAFFSILIFFCTRFLPSRVLYYIQTAFDFSIISYLVISTGFVESPFLVFYALIVVSLSFFEGFKGGITVILSFVVLFIYSFIYFDLINSINFSAYQFILIIVQYCLVFTIVLVLSHYLHKRYMKQEQETLFYEKKLKELEDIHELVVENIDIGIFVLNRAGSIVSCNRMSQEILGRNESEVLGKKANDLIPSIDGKSGIISHNGKYIGYKFQDFSENVRYNLGHLFIFQDVTEREMLKEELLEKEKLAFLGEFAAVVAHEVKNPLGAIKGSFNLLQKEYSGNSRLIGIVNREISRLELALNNLLFVTKNRNYESGNFSVGNILGKSYSDKTLLLSDILKEFREYIRDFQFFDEIVFDYRIYNDFEIPLSKEEFYQIFWNLLLNTHENKKGAKVSVSSYAEDDYIVLDYRDDGTGISKEIINKIGAPFYTTKHSGTGLGTYVIQSILDKHSVSYKFYSSNESEGGGFQLKIFFS